MSDTPETDKSNLFVETWDGKFIDAVPIAFAEELERERNGWREAAYALAEALPPSWEELQPPAAQLAKFKEMVELQNEKTKKKLRL